MSITSTNLTLSLAVPGLIPVPVRIQGFSADKFWQTDNQDLVEVSPGVDGRLTGGYIYNPVKTTFSLQADGPGVLFFDTLSAAMRTTRDVYYITGTAALPATGKVYALTRGLLTSATPMPSAGKVLAVVEYAITWESCNPIPV